MLRKNLIAAAVAPLLLLWWATPARAVDIELESPQENTTVHPGDIVEMTVTVTNDTAEKDNIHVTYRLTIEIGGQPIAVGQAKRRMKLEAGETVSETLVVEIPPDLPLPAPADVTIEGTAVGRRSKTTDTDTLSLTVAP